MGSLLQNKFSLVFAHFANVGLSSWFVAGDIVNTAARMCKFSNSGTIRVTKDIGADAIVSNSKWFNSVSQGLVSIKGKGHMEVYDISCHENRFFLDRHHSYRVALTKTRTSRRNPYGSRENSVSEPSPAASIDEDSHEARQMAQEKARVEARLEADDARLMEQEEVQWQAWLERRHTLSRFLPRFSNTETEKAYRKSKSLYFVQRRGLTMGILFHLFSTAWQWSVFVLPDQGPIFHHYGNPKLIWRMNITQVLLAGQFMVSIALSFLAFFLLGNIRMGIQKIHEFFIRHRWISDPEELMLKDEVSEATDLREKPHSTLSLSKTIILMCNVLYVMLKVLNVAVAFVLGFVWPSRLNQGLHFSLYSISGYAVSHTIFGVSFGGNSILALLSLPSAFVATYVPLQKWISGSDFSEEHDEVFMTRVFVSMIFLIFASICASRYLNFHDRIRWSREHFYSEQLQDVHNHLVDLVPHFYANQLMVGCKHIECSPGRVAVLQLDVCDFTVISQSLHPAKLADIINALVSDFDQYVVRHKLTKIDTM
jgi:class 3 adenylate cyclase